jgi:hypothetical protein
MLEYVRISALPYLDTMYVLYLAMPSEAALALGLFLVAATGVRIYIYEEEIGRV